MEPDEIFDFDEYEEFEKFEDFECGLMDDGACMLAGTEHCDFDCHYRDEC